jgi:hypothetical protein
MNNLSIIYKIIKRRPYKRRLLILLPPDADVIFSKRFGAAEATIARVINEVILRNMRNARQPDE